MRIATPLLFVLLLGLMAGFFFAWSVSAMPGFAAGRPAVWIEAMNRINPAVRNAVFAVPFFGTLPLGLLAAWLARDTPAGPWLIGAWAAYAALGFGTTLLVHIPINTAMEAWDPAAPPADWAAIQARWTLFNHLRAAGSTLGFVLGLVALTRTPMQA